MDIVAVKYNVVESKKNRLLSEARTVDPNRYAHTCWPKVKLLE